MKPLFYLIPVLTVAVAFLIRSELVGNRRQIYVIKPVSILLVILTALLSLWESGSSVYTFGVITGLVFSLGGDIALMFQENKKCFRIGLVLFLLAHIAYAAAFTMVGQFSFLTIVATLVIALLGLGVYRLIHSGLGPMKFPVMAYILVISAMTIQAVSVFASPEIAGFHASMILGGALLFYISDVMLAMNRFWRPWKYNRVSLGFYYGGQMLIALSTAYFVSGV